MLKDHLRYPALVLLLLIAGVVAGCTQRPEWSDDTEAATLSFWGDRPAIVRVEADDYAALWDAAENARRRFGFEAALTDYRGGELTTEPKLSGQIFEPWRDELRDIGSIMESTLTSVRRRVSFELGNQGDGTFWLEPKVIVERQSLGERRLTDVSSYRRALGQGQQRRTSDDDPGTVTGWHAIGRDPALERSLANRIADQTSGKLVRISAVPLVNDLQRAICPGCATMTAMSP